ncbi:hypothetical protein SAMN02745121_02244 [Nannocystis exedens]|uniref:Lipoprotein n=1 Tax=Nannocystis exedens TaxID=54 RepID=A0A1I1WCA1_9BACT|nr:hypothetical protein [Nannocystis exedens]PCC67608.1 hypothetical protein NAEX_00615 [Nannocystis exedens]SFD92722.1 hypothetical protein SAMN02745121_02244 [Nannocystis exedens]
MTIARSRTRARRDLRLAVAAVALVACAPREAPQAPEPTPPAPTASAPPAPGTEPAPAPPDPTAAQPQPGPIEPSPAADNPTRPGATSPSVGDAARKPSKTWPFVAWDRAEAFTFNHVPYGPGVPLRVYDATNGWSPEIAERKPISPAQAGRAVEWVVATRGALEVSKCAFPRHAVVLFAGDTPVGSVNVCFECGDILVWPEFEPPASGPTAERRHRQQMKAYKRVFPEWERFFRDDLGLPLTPLAQP